VLHHHEAKHLTRERMERVRHPDKLGVSKRAMGCSPFATP
jgi:hypothetical protein